VVPAKPSPTRNDNAGAMIASGELDAGVSDGDVTCEFAFTVQGVPVADSDLYSVEVSHRGKVPFKKAEAKRVALSLS